MSKVAIIDGKYENISRRSHEEIEDLKNAQISGETSVTMPINGQDAIIVNHSKDGKSAHVRYRDDEVTKVMSDYLKKAESDQHVNLKLLFYEAAQEMGLSSAVEFRGKDGKWIADMILDFSGDNYEYPKKIAIEVQLSRQSVQKYLERDAERKEEGVLNVWFSKNIKNDDIEYLRNHGVIVVRLVDRNSSIYVEFKGRNRVIIKGEVFKNNGLAKEIIEQIILEKCTANQIDRSKKNQCHELMNENLMMNKIVEDWDISGWTFADKSYIYYPVYTHNASGLKKDWENWMGHSFTKSFHKNVTLKESGEELLSKIPFHIVILKSPISGSYAIAIRSGFCYKQITPLIDSPTIIPWTSGYDGDSLPKASLDLFNERCVDRGRLEVPDYLYSLECSGSKHLIIVDAETNRKTGELKEFSVRILDENLKKIDAFSYFDINYIEEWERKEIRELFENIPTVSLSSIPAINRLCEFIQGENFSRNIVMIKEDLSRSSTLMKKGRIPPTKDVLCHYGITKNITAESGKDARVTQELIEEIFKEYAESIGKNKNDNKTIDMFLGAIMSLAKNIG